MSFNVSPGISESKLNGWLDEAGKKFGYFSDGRVNYQNANVAPIIMCVIKVENEILITKRGFGLADAEGYWSIISGFIDEKKSIKQFCQQEIREELGLKVDESIIKSGKSFTIDNPKEKRKYIVFPCLINFLSKPSITLDHEHTEYTWIIRDRISSYEILDDLPYIIDQALNLEK